MYPITRRQFLARICSFGALGLAAGYPLFVERSIIQTNTYRIVVPNLPPVFSGLRVVHLTDLHYGPLMSLEVIQGVIERANRLKPDLIVCTGDYVHKGFGVTQIDHVWPVLSQLSAPLGVYSVLGNHDHWADTDRSVYWLKRSGQDLRHKKVRLERQGQPLWLAGAGDLIEDHRELDMIVGGIPDRECLMVIAHNPDTADTKYSKRIDLMICGHTHGGQVVIPFAGPPVLPVLNRNYSSGIKLTPRGSTIFISRGIGWAILPVRLNCFPEIAVLELVSAGA